MTSQSELDHDCFVNVFNSFLLFIFFTLFRQLVLKGDPGIGKSSFRSRYIQGNFGDQINYFSVKNRVVTSADLFTELENHQRPHEGDQPTSFKNPHGVGGSLHGWRKTRDEQFT
jgi:hypothetical protein